MPPGQARAKLAVISVATTRRGAPHTGACSRGAAVEAEAFKAQGQESRSRGGPPIWFLFTLPPTQPINEIGREPEGLPTQRLLHERLDSAHAIAGWTMLVLFALHVAGALKHQIVDQHPELARMGLRRRGLYP